MIRISLSKRPPSVNAMYGNNKSGRGKGRFKTKAYKKWISESSLELMTQKKEVIRSGGYGLILRFKKPKNADYSNYVKPIEDFLVSSGITPDDSRNIFTSHYGSDEGGIDIIILDESEAEYAKNTMNNLIKNL